MSPLPLICRPRPYSADVASLAGHLQIPPNMIDRRNDVVKRCFAEVDARGDVRRQLSQLAASATVEPYIRQPGLLHQPWGAG